MTAFPSSPSDGQAYTIGSRTWNYSTSSNGWILNKNGPTGPTGVIGPTGPAGVLLTSIIVDSFTGNGVSTTFTLSVTPISVYNTIVNLDGLVQTPNINYTISGSNINFTTAPGVNSSIDVVHLLTGSAITGPVGTDGVTGPTGPAGIQGLTRVTVPSTSVGQSGDIEGYVAFDINYFYYCAAVYDGISNIWKRIIWSTNTW